MEQLNPQSRRDPYGSRINRAPSTLRVYLVPWLTILLGSLTPWLPIIAPAPILPPFGFLLLLAWRLLRPGLLPPWAGLPLGLFDDFYSGQPMGSGVLLFSIALIVIELIEIRFPWRNFWFDWLTAIGLTVPYLIIAATLSGTDLTLVQLGVLGPQILLSVVLFPIIARVVAMLDRFRLMRVRRID
jgi:rod shape-determining protein MreD